MLIKEDRMERDRTCSRKEHLGYSGPGAVELLNTSRIYDTLSDLTVLEDKEGC